MAGIIDHPKPLHRSSDIQVNKKRNRILFFGVVILIAVKIAIGISLAVQYEYFKMAISFIDQHMPPILFVALMVILPVVGFPISIFLIMGGIKFGILFGMLLWLLILPIHTIIAYYLARWLRKPLERFLSRKMDYHVPEIPEKGVGMFSFLFLAIPGIPYATKNYILPLAGVPFRFSVLMNCIVQSAQGIPFIVLGRSAAEMDLTLLYIALFIFIIGYIILRWLKKKYGDKIGKP
jgi:uncharacterized membrane protein YdjX (TVP38/TMEM64 family)